MIRNRLPTPLSKCSLVRPFRVRLRSTANPGRVGRYVAWAGSPGTLETVDYKAGTLSIDLVDADTNSLV